MANWLHQVRGKQVQYMVANSRNPETGKYEEHYGQATSEAGDAQVRVVED